MYCYKTGTPWRDLPECFGNFRVVHARTEALGNPTGFYLTGGSAHDLCGSDELLDVHISQTWLADRAYDTDARVIEPIEAVHGHAVILPKCHRLQPRDFDKERYKYCHLTENFFAKIKQY